MISKIDIKRFKGIDSVSLDDCGPINAIVGKNNSGKSSILHAIDMAGLAFSVNDWNQFQPKLQVKDLFDKVGAFSIDIEYQDGSAVKVSANPQYGPTKSPPASDDQAFKSILIWPDASAGMKSRNHRTPKWVVDRIEAREFSVVDSLEILFAIKYYAFRNERGFSPSDYYNLIEEVRNYFPDIKEIESERTQDDIATLTYEEYGRKLDIIYSGSGLKHFIDVLLKTTISRADVILLDEPEMGLHPDLQRRFLGYLEKLASEKGVQIFMATHSQVLLNYADSVTYFRVQNTQGTRTVSRVESDAIQTLLSDMGLRPSDVFNQDICILVEGASEVVFFEHIIRNLYETEFAGLAVGIIQYAGGAADGILKGSISVSNIVPAQQYTYWFRDRDANPNAKPSRESERFKKALAKDGIPCHILGKREIEYYYPDSVLKEAQQGDQAKEKEVLRIKNGHQKYKFRKAAKSKNVCVPQGKYLRKLLSQHMTSKSQLDSELRNIIEGTLLQWKDQII